MWHLTRNPGGEGVSLADLEGKNISGRKALPRPRDGNLLSVVLELRGSQCGWSVGLCGEL